MQDSGTAKLTTLPLRQLLLAGFLALITACSVASKEEGASLESRASDDAGGTVGILNEVSNTDTGISSADANAASAQDKPAGDGTDGDNSSDPVLALLQGSETLHGIVEMRCSGCHNGSSAPKFYEPGDQIKTMSRIYGLDVADESKLNSDNGKVSLIAPLRSLMIKKVAPDDFEVPSEVAGQPAIKITGENHNCWSGDCKADATTLLAAISEWAAGTAEYRAKLAEEDTTPKSSVAKLVDAPAAEAREAIADSYKIQAEEATADGNWMNQDLNVGDGMALYNTDSCFNTGNVPADAANALAGASLTFNFTNVSPGDYYVYVSAAAAGGNMDSFFLSFGGTDYAHQVEQSGLVNEVRLGQASQNNNMNQVVGIQTVDNTGTFDLQVSCRESDARLDYIMLCPFDVDAIDGCVAREAIPEQYVQIDVSELCGTPAAIAFRHFTTEDGAYAFREPTLVDPSSTNTQMVPLTAGVSINNIKIGVNSFVDATRSTFASEYSVAAGTTTPISTATVFVDSDQGPALDEISVTVDSCTRL